MIEQKSLRLLKTDTDKANHYRNVLAALENLRIQTLMVSAPLNFLAKYFISRYIKKLNKERSEKTRIHPASLS